MAGNIQNIFRLLTSCNRYL